jgi:hypothetical protein
MHGTTLFQRRTFHLVAFAFPDIADLLFLRIRQVEIGFVE